MENVQAAWSALLDEVRRLGDVPADAAAAVQRDDVQGYKQLMALVARADRIRGLHMALLGDGLRMEAKSFVDTEVGPEKEELASVGRRLLRPAGPASPTARLLWLATTDSQLVATAAEANERFALWHKSLTHFPALESR